MDSTGGLRSGEAVKARIASRVQTLIEAYRDLLDGAQIPSELTSLAGVTTAYKLDLAAQTMIRASEDLLTLIRQMQEVWLFGKLDTLGKSEVKERTEVETKHILEMLQQLVDMKSK